MIKAYGLDRASFNQGINAKFNFSIDEEIQPTMTSRGVGGVCYIVNEETTCEVYDARSNGDGKIVPTITGDHALVNENRVTDYTALCVGNGQTDQVYITETVHALNCMHDQQAVVTMPAAVVRRLTPKEVERLQGFPDDWTDIGDWEVKTKNGKKRRTSSDAARYRALGNSIAVPTWVGLLDRLSAKCKDCTMGSLFDGIGGFPLIWESINGKGSAVWASEIEPFCVAVTQRHFPESE